MKTEPDYKKLYGQEMQLTTKLVLENDRLTKLLMVYPMTRWNVVFVGEQK